MKALNRTRPTAARRFELASAGDGFEVVDNDGWPVTGCLSHREAVEERDILNAATVNGHAAVRTALGAAEEA